MGEKTIPDFTPASTIDEVLLHLDQIIDQTIEDNSYLCAFAYVYRRTTFEISKAIAAEQFEDPGRMEKMDVSFANLYIMAFHNYYKSVQTSKAWEFAFNVGKERMAIIQHILLGMNAHINLDLSIAAANISEGKKIIALKNDFMKVNQILADLTNVMQKSLGKVSFTMRLLDIFGFRSDEKIINFSIQRARDFAWLNAMELALLDKKTRTLRIKEIDNRVVQLSNLIKDPPGKFLSLILKIISLFEISDKTKIIKKMREV